MELDFHTRQNATDGAVLAGVFSEFEEAEVKLERGRDKFQKATVEPVDELRYCLALRFQVDTGSKWRVNSRLASDKLFLC